MKREKKKVASYAMDRTVLADLREIARETNIPQSRIVDEAVKEKLAVIRARLQRGETVALSIS